MTTLTAPMIIQRIIKYVDCIATLEMPFNLRWLLFLILIFIFHFNPEQQWQWQTR